MPRLVVLIISFSAFSFAYSQRTLSENLWTSLVFRYKTTNLQFTGDAGYRMCDNFIHTKRTALARLTVEKIFKETNSLGAGYAYFEHFVNSFSKENRLFIEYSKQLGYHKSLLLFRVRDEIRTFSDRETTNRLRIQASCQREFSKNIEIRLASEVFYTFGAQQLIEQRHSTGCVIKFNKQLKMMPFYTLQFQSNVHYAQHILGTQVQVNLKKSSLF